MLRLNPSTTVVLLVITLLPSSAAAEDSNLASLREIRKILFKEDSSLDHTFAVKENHPRLRAIKQLEADGSAQAVRILKKFLTTHGMERKLKQHALTALGRIGTPDAIDAILKFEYWSQKRFAQPPPFQLGKTEHASDHFQAYYLHPVNKTADEKGKTWTIFPWNRYGRQDLWLTSSTEKDSWSHPVLLDLPATLPLRRISETAWDKNCQFQVKDDSVTVVCDGSAFEARISKSLKDSDADGLPDIVEARFLTDPNNPDSDKDAVPDGNDSNPLTPVVTEPNELHQIRQAVFSVLFATCNSRDAVVIVERGDFAKQEYYGFTGTVLRSPKIREGFVNVTELDVKLQSPNSATATISDWEGNLAASVHEAKLKRINGKWVVVQFMLTIIS